MSLVGDIFQSVFTPRKIMRKQMDVGIREEQTLFYALFFGAMHLVSQMPNIAVKATKTEQSIANLTAMQFASSVFITPLVIYGIALVFHFIMRAFNGAGLGVQTRRAVFWAAIVSVPFMLISGIVNSVAPFYYVLVAGVITTLVFAWVLAANLTEVHFPNSGKKQTKNI
ncbi:hypothetical protein GCM10008927_03100 [Amylibacter ulvae]|uniref:Yip1 domain-containing protein n=2 Tax=Paramylibacter ulvae TaxID=1651968 RepID=A0ABQ3CUI4_9RHOB|nr:hypothetical protein GCM10008927_03100 [Amylibacter ulvae]